MQTRIISTTAIFALLFALVASEALAAGRGGGGAGRGGGGTSMGSGATSRPAGSQRRDGTFATTGTTASGATSRPGYGQGLQDGSGANR
ncbi:MAG: hypothetical protein ACOY3Z_07220 [Thermodesulfobacteriota bacterium]